MVDVEPDYFLEAATLFLRRTNSVAAPNVSLAVLARLDARLTAYLDGLVVAGDAAAPLLERELDYSARGTVFTASVQALKVRHLESLDAVWPRAERFGPIRNELVAAFGWVEPNCLQGFVPQLMADKAAVKRFAAVASCSAHRIDPGLVSEAWFQDTAPLVLARVLRVVGEIGHRALVSDCVAGLDGGSDDCRFWAAWSAVLLGDRRSALERLIETALTAGTSHRSRAFRLVLQASDLHLAHGSLQQIAKAPAHWRWLIQGSGIVGDPTYAAWLIGHMSKPNAARLAGEAFALITGADLDQLQLCRSRPEEFESGPTDDLNDPNVDVDPDEGLPWPDPQKVAKWWAANNSRFPKGTRYFLGKPVTWENCVEVLKNGYQRQRVLAAQYLCLLRPGTPLFNTSAPAWRQQRLLARM